jgi:hypothetical protein
VEPAVDTAIAVSVEVADKALARFLGKHGSELYLLQKNERSDHLLHQSIY